MLVTIPSVKTRRDDGSRVNLPGVSGSIRVTGPSWVEETISAISGIAPWGELEYAGTGTSGDGSVHVTAPPAVPASPADLPDASYAMSIVADGITVDCESPLGLLQALRVLSAARDETGTVPGGSIADTPRFRWRGIHLDVARHMFSVEFIKRLLRLMASLGFNVFHWHLTEDQGWRIQIDSYPRLTEIGAYRTGKDGTRYGGFYTKDDVREVVRFAGTLGILVVPEIELPGHAMAAIAAYPELSCQEEQLTVRNEWGICDDVFCPGTEAVFDFLNAVFDEVCELFPSRIVHVGGDECQKVRWAECPKCAERMKTERLADLEELQSYAVGRAAEMLASRGRTAIGWDEILEGGLPPGTMVMSWRGVSGGIAAATAGHEVVMTPTSHCYFDYRQSADPDAFGYSYPDATGRIPVTTVEKVYQFDPLDGLPADTRSNVLGGQGNVWSELLETEELAEKMIAPRILALAEVLWAYPDHRDFQAFKPRALAALDNLKRMGWHAADAAELT